MPLRVVCFGLPGDCKESEVEELFEKYGKISAVRLRDMKGGAEVQAFIDYGDERDAEDALNGLDNKDYEGKRLRVEWARDKGDGKKGKGKRSDSRDRGKGKGWGKGPFDDWYDKGKGKKKGKGKPDARDFFKVKVSDMPEGASWQDLKDFSRKAYGCEPRVAEVERDGTGFVGFDTKKEALQVVEELNGESMGDRRGENKSKVRLEYDDRDEPRGKGGYDDDRRGSRRDDSRGRRPSRRDRSRDRRGSRRDDSRGR